MSHFFCDSSALKSTQDSVVSVASRVHTHARTHRKTQGQIECSFFCRRVCVCVHFSFAPAPWCQAAHAPYTRQSRSVLPAASSHMQGTALCSCVPVAATWVASYRQLAATIQANSGKQCRKDAPKQQTLACMDASDL